jgi:hypothetical protein
MTDLLMRIPYSALIIFTVVLLLAPFNPMPHVMEKLILLKSGTLTRSMDIFDLFFHLAPLFILIAKIIVHYRSNG